MSKFIRRIFKNDTISLSECNDGFWLYDENRGMNLSMRAKTEQDAFVEALMYYQKRYKELALEFSTLNEKVENFLSQFERED